jgi:uncharacterized protein YjiS (DUF1127 family)
LPFGTDRTELEVAMTMTTLTFPAAGLFARLTHAAGTVALRAVNFLHALKARHELEGLVGFDDRMLADIGLTRGDLRDAIAEPLWRDPSGILVARSRERRRARRLQVLSADGLVEAPSIVPAAQGQGVQAGAFARYY